jgi:excisionase family DNA binding protein
MLLRIGQVCEQLALSEPTVRRMVKAGTLTPVRIGGSVRYRLEDVRRLAAGSPNATSAATTPRSSATSTDLTGRDESYPVA